MKKAFELSSGKGVVFAFFDYKKQSQQQEFWQGVFGKLIEVKLVNKQGTQLSEKCRTMQNSGIEQMKETAYSNLIENSSMIKRPVMFTSDSRLLWDFIQWKCFLKSLINNSI